MEKLVKYRQEILNFLNDRKEARTQDHSDIKHIVVADYEGDHYQLLYYGWRPDRYIFSVLYHFDIINEKIWLQQNTTEDEVVDFFLDRGVPKKDIVLGLVTPEARTFMGFAAA